MSLIIVLNIPMYDATLYVLIIYLDFKTHVLNLSLSSTKNKCVTVCRRNLRNMFYLSSCDNISFH